MRRKLSRGDDKLAGRVERGCVGTPADSVLLMPGNSQPEAGEVVRDEHCPSS
ncbi:hypothetical protein ACGFIE_25825 [Micromonospora sp. NPDC049275]|uniref:hypothetical protein n=1 Tax=Micromonospora sp. NPDC049275 TaxID=3364268 RepID=UPI00371F4E2D